WDSVTDAQRRRPIAQQAFWTSVVEYNKSIADLHVRKGSIMDYDGIMLEEGPWPQKAYWDALARARERDAGWYVDYGWTRPKVISRGPIAQGLPATNSGGESATGTANAEGLPAQEPTPAKPPVDAGEPSPLPPPRGVPQETRSQPRPTSPRAMVTNPGDSSAGDAKTMPFGIRQTRPQQPVAPASFWSEDVGAGSNPLRGTKQRAIGTGVAES